MTNSFVAHKGKIIRVIETHLPDGRIIEVATRPPGTRIIIHNLETNEILLSTEIRRDIGEDIRLPGGKVRDTFDEWEMIMNTPAVEHEIILAAAKEAREEAGIDPIDLKIFSVSTSGGPTISWDMYYLVTTKYNDLGHQQLEIDEKIKTNWVPVREVKEICLSGKMREGRSVAALLQYLYSVEKSNK